jgi:hypothetical protein
MPRRTPTSDLTVLAISEARMRFQTREANGGSHTQQDQEAFLLLDLASYLAQRTSLDRRKRASIENYGEISPRLIREERELEQEYAHVADMQIAA